MESVIMQKELRDNLVNNEYVLDLIKPLIMLPNTEYVHVENVANFYEVSKDVIKMTCNRHREELISDGLRVLIGEELGNIKLLSGYNSKGSQLMLLTRRAVLRIGMILKNSRVAEQVRTYLLNSENSQTRQHLGDPPCYKGKWEQEHIEYALEVITRYANEGKKLGEAIRKIGIDFNTSYGNVSQKYYKVIQYNLPESVLPQMSRKKAEDNFGNEIKMIIEEDPSLKQNIESDAIFDLRMKLAKLEGVLSEKDAIIESVKVVNSEKDKKIELLNIMLADKVKECEKWKKRCVSMKRTFNILTGQEAEELEEYEPTRLKMMPNGNLERA